MSLRTKIQLLTVVLTLAIVPSARAGGGAHTITRCLGIGWSDGYHAYTNCPPPPAHGQRYGGYSNWQPMWPGEPGPSYEYLPQPRPTPAKPQPSSVLRPSVQALPQPATSRPWIPAAERLR